MMSSKKAIDTKAESIVRVPRTGGPNQPALHPDRRGCRARVEPRDELARMLTADIQFARATTNRIWAEFMGFGIVEPIDEFDLDRITRPAVTKRLDSSTFESLSARRDGQGFPESNFSFKQLVRTIMKSSAYQLSSNSKANGSRSTRPITPVSSCAC